MVDIIYNIFEDDFRKDQTHSYDLSILMGKDRFSYVISNQQKQVLSLRAYHLSDDKSQSFLKQLLLEDSIIRNKFRTVKVGVFSPRFSLLPLDLFDASEATSYLSLTNTLLRNDQVLYDDVELLKAVNIYAFEEQYINCIVDYLPDAKFYHISTGLINNFINNFDSTSSKNIFLNIYDHYVMLTVVENSKLIFHNIFSFKASSDCLYYVLLVYKQLNISPQKIPLHIVGELVMDSEIYKLLLKYIKTIHFVNRPTFYLFSEKIQNSCPKNFFFDLFSLKLCE
ncbi:MAG: DUF3822 family protein [Saprospiraceae bacterium]|nr:DUF3822 family protein [Saprospiraceae bacterium]